MKKNNKKKNSFFQTTLLYSLLIIVLLLGYYIFCTDSFNSRLNYITASYISFNNNSTTDMLKITDLKKYSDNKGNSNKNKSNINFSITGKVDCTYEIVLYHIGNKIDEKFVKYSLINEKNKEYRDVISNSKKTLDGGFIIYEGTLNEGKRWVLKMWIDNKYSKDIENTSYEIRIKTK